MNCTNCTYDVTGQRFYRIFICIGPTALIEGDPYNGQVYIKEDTVSDSAPYGIVYININGESRPVCAHGYTNATLHSVCQQMGYTGAYTNSTDNL